MMMVRRMNEAVAALRPITLAEVNACLEAWGHRMGPLSRPFGRDKVIWGWCRAG
jgi:hypothetical protein